MLNNLETIFSQIKNSLLNSEELRKLLFYNTPDALLRSVPTIEEVRPQIYTKPIIAIFEESEENKVNSFIQIGLVEADILDSYIAASIKVSVASERSLWDLEDGITRPLRISSLVLSSLNNLKLGPAGSLRGKYIKEVYFNEEIVGYTILFDTYEEQGEVVNEF